MHTNIHIHHNSPDVRRMKEGCGWSGDRVYENGVYLTYVYYTVIVSLDTT